MNIYFTEFQDILNKNKNKNKKGISDVDRNIELLKLEADYQKLISNYSPAYLSGSSWYVGPSLIEHIRQGKINQGCLGILCVVSHYTR